MDTQTPGNVPEYSVSEIAGAVKRTLEGAFGRVRVRGELVEVKRYSSGHTYLCLKDEGGTLRGIIWKTAARSVGLKPEDGVEVIATGRISAWGDKSQYQLIIERLEYAGAGAMLARIEALRVKLAAEGLFERKRPLPYLPALVGVVTSAQGAVLHDIQTTIARRFGRPILLWPVPVQGEGAAEKIAAAIAGFCTLPQDGVARPDVLIVARGGGSLEDLMAFNDEAVVRAAAACSIPLISAVGHETDTTLIDFALLTPRPNPHRGRRTGRPRTQRTARRSRTAIVAPQHGAEQKPADRQRKIGNRRRQVARSAGHSGQRPHARGRPRTAPGSRTAKPARRAPRRTRARRTPHPRSARAPHKAPCSTRCFRIAPAVGITHLGAKAPRCRCPRYARLSVAPIEARLREQRSRLDVLGARLDGASYEKVLARGFVLVRDAKGHAVTSAVGLSAGTKLNLRFQDGEVDTAVTAKQAALPF